MLAYFQGRLLLVSGKLADGSNLQKISTAVVVIEGWCWACLTSKLRVCKYSFQLFFPFLLE